MAVDESAAPTRSRAIPTDGGVVTGRLSVYPSGYARFTDRAYDAIGVDRRLVDAVALWTNHDRIGIRFHTTQPVGPARDDPCIDTGTLPPNAVSKRDDGRFEFAPILREVFGVDASVLDATVRVTCEWLPGMRMWQVSAVELADALDVEGVTCDGG